VTPKLRLLYAEDDPDTRELIVLALEMEGFEVVCPEDLTEFLRLAKNETWQAYMLDTWMPEVDGFELCGQIRGFDPHTPIVFYSGAALERDKARAFASGATAYFVKPIAFPELVDGLKAVITLAAGVSVR